MRFLLINPFYPLAEMPSPPLGVGYLAAAMERADIEVRVLDTVVTKYSKPKLETVMNDFQPDIVGATSVTMTFDSAIEGIVDAKHIDPSVKTAMGGAHVSFCAAKTMRKYPELDLVGRGEGEEMILELCRAVEKDAGYGSISGLVWRDGDRIVDNGPRAGWMDVKTLPLPARHLTPLTRYRAIGTPISMTTSRGCPFQCIFCVGRQMVGSKIRWREAQSVVDEMELLAERGFVQINLADDLFTARKRHAYAVCDEIQRRGLDIPWTSFANVNTVDVPLLKRMQEAGCLTVSFGLESGNQEILKTVKKGTKIHKILAAVEACNEAGVLPHGSFIVGLPGETDATIQESIAFSKKLKSMGAQTGFHMLAPFPGTAVAEESEKYKLKILTDDFTQYHANYAITETPGASRETQQAVADEIDGATERMFLDLAARIEDGTATEADRKSYANIERQGVYYDMMLQDALETRGAWHHDRVQLSSDQAVTGITDRVAKLTGRASDMCRRAITHGLETNLLKYRSENGLTRWDWNDSPEALAVSETWTTPPEKPSQGGSVTAQL